MRSILLILPYFGKWPIWFDAYLVSIEKNPTVNWLFVTDCEIPKKYPGNIHFVKTTLLEFNLKVNAVLGVKVPLSTRKICDIRPAFGAIFQEYLEDYDFWGFCDADVIWGDIRKFMTEDILTHYDIISSRKGAISGHFNLFRNTTKLNTLFKQVPHLQMLLEQPRFMWFDERILTSFIQSKLEDTAFEFKVYWPKILLNQEGGRDSHQEYYLDKWQWNDGRMLQLEQGKIVSEVMYLHFINWKKTMKYCEIIYSQNPASFYISYSGIHYQLHSILENKKLMIINLYNGYYAKEYRRIKRKRFNKLFKKIIKKIKCTMS